MLRRFAFATLALGLVTSVALGACGGSSSSPATADSDGGGLDDAGDPTADDGGVTIGPDGAPIPLGPDTTTVIVEPSDKAQALLNAIQSAKTSIHMTMYLLNDKRFITALVAAKAAGRDVKVLLNQTFPGGAGTNQSAFSQLQAGGVAVAWAPATYTLTHEKCVILDGVTAWIMTMNLENTSSSNREFLAIVTRPTDVQEAEAIFTADATNAAIVPVGPLVVSPNNSRDRLLALINSAKKSVDLEGEELSDYKIVNALIARQTAGVPVRVVLADNPPPASQASAVMSLKAGNVKVVSLGNPYIHAKSIVVDGTSAYVGSENFTTGSLNYNRELGIVMTNAPAVSTVGATIAKDFAAGTPL